MIVAAQIRYNRNGFALISVVWLNAILMIIAIGIIELAHTRGAIAFSDEKKAIAVAAIEGALLSAVNRLEIESLNVAQFPITFDQQVGNTVVSVEITPESRKVAFNAASAETLQEFFEYTGESGTNARRIAAAVVDWRDEDRVPEYFGAEASAYSGDPSGFLPRNGLIESLGEIQWVKGMSPELYECIKPFASVYAQSAEVDFDRLPGNQVMLRTNRDAAVESVINPQRSAAGEAFTIDMHVSDDSHVTKYRAVIRLTGNRTSPFWLLAWSEMAPGDTTCISLDRGSRT